MTDNARNIADPIYVQETLLKKRKVNQKAAAEKALKKDQLRKTKKTQLKKTKFKRADEFVRDHRTVEKQGSRLRVLNQGKLKKSNKVKGTDKLLFVVRIKTEHAIHPNLLKTLKKYRLSKMNQGGFVVYNDKTKQDLQKIEPFVSYGVPSLKTVRDLIVKRGATLIKGVRTPLSDNMLIEERLGEHGIICLEDIIHEIVSKSDNFEVVSKFLVPFELNNPVKGWRHQKLKDLTDREDGNDDQDDINKLVEAMN
ncbi:ribosomal protein L30p/L7e, partial [Backusella circina FSU 941]